MFYLLFKIENSVLICFFSGFEHDVRNRSACRYHWENIVFFFNRHFKQIGAVVIDHFLNSAFEVFTKIDPVAWNPEPFGNGYKVGVLKFGERIPFLKEELLPLSYHSEEVVIKNDNFDG